MCQTRAKMCKCFCSSRCLKMKRSPQWRSLCQNDWTYQQTSSGCFIKEKLSQVDCPSIKCSITFLHNSNCLTDQFILHQGRPTWFWLLTILLSLDEHRLSDYSIGPEAKLNLVIRPVGERSGVSGMVASSSSTSTSSSQERVWQTVSTILARHFSPADAAKVHEQLIKVYVAYDISYYAFL